MENPLAIVLTITVIGMSLLFLALGFFYGLLSLMMAAVRDPSPTVERKLDQGLDGEQGRRREMAVSRAAAIAVALARLQCGDRQRQYPQRETIPPVNILLDSASARQPSFWWSLHQQRRLQNTPLRRFVFGPVSTFGANQVPPACEREEKRSQ